ncbi:MAG: CpsB/CapC family capsule biosynthesis tyrosine phosphatase [Armatimonadia bacterium]
MIDLHCHILPGVDDGPRDVDEALAVARLAVADGTQVIAATPHVDDTYKYPDPDLIRALTARFNERLRAEKIPLQVLPGAEVRVGTDLLEKLQSGQVMTLGDRGKHVLLELPTSSHALYAGELFFRLQLAGYIPVLAHVERVALFRSQPGLLRDFHDRGCLLQVNAESLSGRGGWTRRRYTQKLLREGLIDIVASDGHNTNDRKPLLSIAKKALNAEFERLTDQTPRRILQL